MSQQPFQKFINKKKNSAVKETHKQERKKAKKERAEYFDKIREEKRQAYLATLQPAPQPAAPGGKKSYADKKGYGRPSASNRPAPAPKAAPARPAPSAPAKESGTAKTKAAEKADTAGSMPLNKFLAHCGVASRREAVELIKAGKVKVNGQAVTEPAHKVAGTDEVKYNGKKLFVTKNLVYILLNKPKDYITTTDDPQGRKTVLDLIKQATAERVYPIGRLDRNTSGVLLLTNDGELTQRLSHPSYEIRKIYEAKLDRPLAKGDFEKIQKGLKLEDGPVTVDALGYVDSKDKSIIGIELHSGRNRIVRRIFEHLGYDVKGLDRVMYATLTKKNVERGKWRYLSEKEIRLLKYMNKSKGTKQPQREQEKP
jgi:23S rRNA pseudouridine2605 synthase